LEPDGSTTGERAGPTVAAMVLVLATAVLAVVIAVALVLTIRASRRPTPTASRSARLPVGAEAAIWSILEAVPDPRNHLALTRDLTGEVRIAGTMLDPAVRAQAAADAAPAPAPAPRLAPAPGELWIGEPTVAVTLSESLDLRDLEHAS
jgi:hypothetical protein